MLDLLVQCGLDEIEVRAAKLTLLLLETGVGVGKDLGRLGWRWGIGVLWSRDVAVLS